MGQEIITADGEVIEVGTPDVSLALGLSRQEIDVQIATAHKFPRSVDRATKQIMSLATLDEETAAECIYALPRGGKPITGPSIRLAEIVQQCWGNNRVAARVVHVDEKFVESESAYHDLETNSATMARVRRPILGKGGRRYNDDMINMTGNAACSIARRNAILAGVPKPVWRKVEMACRKIIAGDETTLTVRRAKSLAAFHHFGVKPEQVYGALGVAGEDDIGLDQIVTLRGMFSALKNGEATVEEMFSNKTAGVSHEVVKDPFADPTKAETPAAETVPTNAATTGEATSQPADGSIYADTDEEYAARVKKLQEERAEQIAAAEQRMGISTSDVQPGPPTAKGDRFYGTDDETRELAAYAAGEIARKTGKQKKAMPKEYLKLPEMQIEHDAWLNGFDEAGVGG